MYAKSKFKWVHRVSQTLASWCKCSTESEGPANKRKVRCTWRQRNRWLDRLQLHLHRRWGWWKPHPPPQVLPCRLPCTPHRPLVRQLQVTSAPAAKWNRQPLELYSSLNGLGSKIETWINLNLRHRVEQHLRLVAGAVSRWKSVARRLLLYHFQ